MNMDELLAHCGFDSAFEMIKFYLGEQPILDNVETWNCEKEQELKYVLDNINELVVKEVDGSGGYGMLIGPKSSKSSIEEFKNKLSTNPKGYIRKTHCCRQI